MDQLNSLILFVRAAQHCSFSAAARQLGTSPASVSRAVQQLEEKLGTRLLNRTTRRISLTEDGTVFYEYCRQILSELEEAELALSKGLSRNKLGSRVSALLVRGEDLGVTAAQLILTRVLRHAPHQLGHFALILPLRLGDCISYLLYPNWQHSIPT